LPRPFSLSDDSDLSEATLMEYPLVIAPAAASPFPSVRRVAATGKAELSIFPIISELHISL
jgi:hypothetical protein